MRRGKRIVHGDKELLEVSAMKRFCAWFGILILLLPAVPDLDDAIALQDGWFNVDPSDDVISVSKPYRFSANTSAMAKIRFLRQQFHAA